MHPIKKKELDPPQTGPIVLKTDKPVKVALMQTNQFVQKFVPGQGEVVVRFKNFTRADKYFTAIVTETDAAGVPIGAKAPVPEAKD